MSEGFGDWRSAMARYQFPTAGDRAFYERVYRTDPAVYRRRIAAVGFSNLGRVLDAGCGYGQWSLALADGSDVIALDVSHHRASVVVDRARATDRRVFVGAASVDSLPLADACVDGVFCYGAIFFVDYRAALAEFWRVLRPGGRIYVGLNDVGWFLWYLTSNHNAGTDFRPRRMAIEALINTLGFYAGRPFRAGAQMAVPARDIRRTLRRLGFQHVRIAGDGRLGATPPFADAFFLSRWFGLRAVYEVVASKGS